MTQRAGRTRLRIAWREIAAGMLTFALVAPARSVILIAVGLAAAGWEVRQWLAAVELPVRLLVDGLPVRIGPGVTTIALAEQRVGVKRADDGIWIQGIGVVRKGQTAIVGSSQIEVLT